MIIKHNKTRDGWTGRVLTMGKEYPVIEIIERPYEVSVRIKDDQGTPGIYPLALFEITNDTIPPSWKIVFWEKNEVALRPTAFKTFKRDFWEDYFDSNPESQAKGEQIVDEEIEKINAFHSETETGIA